MALAKKKKRAVSGKAAPKRKRRSVSGVKRKKRSTTGTKMHAIERVEKNINKLESLRKKAKTGDAKLAYARLINKEHDKIVQIGKRA